jgi:hypothetical protein
MFEASGLLTTPYLPAETLVSGCYDYMFANNSDMCFVQSNFTTTPGTAYTNNWLYDVSENGVFIFNSDAPWANNYNNYRNASGIPDYVDQETGEYGWVAQGSNYQERWVHDSYYCDGVERHEITKEQISNDGGATWEDTGNQEDDVVVYDSIHCGFVSGDTDDEYDSSYIDTKALKNADLTFVNEEGKPNIKTDADGYVTEFTYTDATDDSPVMFNGTSTVDTDYHAFKTDGARNFEIIIKAYCDGNDQVYKAKPTYPDDNMVNLFTLRGESGGSVTYADGFSFRIAKGNKDRMVINGNAQGTALGNPYVVDDGTHLWYWRITYINGYLKIEDIKNNYRQLFGKQCDFRLDDHCSAVLACAVQPDGSYYRYCKCKFFEFRLRTL